MKLEPISREDVPLEMNPELEVPAGYSYLPGALMAFHRLIGQFKFGEEFVLVLQYARGGPVAMGKRPENPNIVQKLVYSVNGLLQDDVEILVVRLSSDFEFLDCLELSHGWYFIFPDTVEWSHADHWEKPNEVNLSVVDDGRALLIEMYGGQVLQVTPGRAARLRRWWRGTFLYRLSGDKWFSIGEHYHLHPYSTNIERVGGDLSLKARPLRLESRKRIKMFHRDPNSYQTFLASGGKHVKYKDAAS